MNFAMNNFPIIKDGKQYWVARNMAVACFVFAPINRVWCVLANQEVQVVVSSKDCGIVLVVI